MPCKIYIIHFFHAKELEGFGGESSNVLGVVQINGEPELSGVQITMQTIIRFGEIRRMIFE
jgi:hypothetical protein